MEGSCARVLTLRGVAKRFGGLVAVDKVDFEVAKGRLLGIIGPNGAGKTTLFNLITGIMPYDEGSIQFMEREVSHVNAHGLARLGVARTFQTVRLIRNANVLENVLLGCQTRDNRLYKSLLGLDRHERHAALEKTCDALRQLGLYEKRGLIVSQLPYGDLRRVEFARALASEPTLLLLDEPAAGMNSEEILQLHELIMALRLKGMTILLIEHNMPFVMGLSDQIVVLNFGQKIAQGSPEEVRRNSKVIEAYLGTDSANPA